MYFFLIFTALFCHGCVYSQDHWKGEEYAKHSESQKSSAQDFIDKLEIHPDDTLLDVGCGDGKITAFLASLASRGSVVGVDFSSSMIEIAKKNFSQENLLFIVGDAASLDFKEEFDLITSFTAMHFVLNQGKALEGFQKALKPFGRLAIQIPMGLPEAIQLAVDRVISTSRWKDAFIGFQLPWRFYQIDEYKNLLMEAHLIPQRLEVVRKHECFPSRELFHGFLKQWFPYLRPLNIEDKDTFLSEVLDAYAEILPPDATGRWSFIVDRLEIEAIKGSKTRIGSY